MTDLEQALADLQTAVRQKTKPDERTVSSRRIPDDLARADARTLGLTADERAAMDAAASAISADIRFEHLARRADELIWRFVCQAHIDRSHSHVDEFLTQHARSLLHLTCYFGIENLAVDKRRELLGLVLMPADDPEVPTESVWFDLSKPIGSVASVPTRGTEYEPMKDRAAKLVDHSLRVLRVALREHDVIPDELLRFRRGTSYSFGGRIAGARRRPDEGWNPDLSDDLLSLAASQPVYSVDVAPAFGVKRQANLALRWIERGMFAADPLESLLFCFFALEALLGRKSEDLKASGLTFRRAMLSVATRGDFSAPDRIYYLYRDVRSAAVHGAEPPDVSLPDARRFAWDVRHTLNEYLEYADAKDFKKRGRLLTALDNHPDRQELVEWLRANSREPWWQDFPTAAS